MTRDERISEIEEVCRLSQAIDKVYDDARCVLGSSPETPLWDAVFGVKDALIKQTAKLIGDEGQWLSWFIHENDCGKKAMQAGLSKTTMRPIRTARQLARLIEAT